MTYELYINGNKVDFDSEGVSILFQKQRTDYTNPTIVKNSFTKTIKLPGTKVNNSIFNEIWKLDRIQWSNAFNASKRTPFILMNNGSLVEQGYVKLNNIVRNSNTNSYTYEVTLYGELGNLLYGLSYDIDSVTEEVSPLTLANLDFEFSEFIINKDLIYSAWKRLEGDSSVAGDDYKIFDTINFMVSYDGIPSANNFDPKNVWCSVDRKASVNWKDQHYYANQFPSEITEDSVIYKYINTMVSRLDPEDHYGLMELNNDLTPLEMRDFRSYLLRPVVKISKIFDAISNYINKHYGYTVDLSDSFFSSSEFTSTWMTLSMLYEIDPEVETGTVFTKEQLFSNTSSPASYLISYCKTYGIYIDVDYYNKKLVLTRLPHFFNKNKINELKIDLSREKNITPLSFDKASYTFDYSDGEGEFLKKYKDNYGIQYGSKKVNTGYRFDAATAPYIDNNIFKQGVDSLEQSIYYRYPYAVRDTFGTDVLFTYPVALMDEANLPTYKLFNIDAYNTTGEIKTVDGEMSPHWYPEISDGSSTIKVYNIANSGYQFMNVWWAGLRQNVWQDSFPKLQFHSEDNKSIDGKNVLVRFDGFRSPSYGRIINTENRTFWNVETYNDGTIDATAVNYLLSDDNAYLKNILGKNCYYDNPMPAEGIFNYITVINKIPSFVRGGYNYLRNITKNPVFYVASYDSYVFSTSSSAVSVSEKTSSYYLTSINASTGRQYAFLGNISLDANHRYFIAAAIKTAYASDIKSGNNYAYPDILGSTLIDKKDISFTTGVQLVGSIVQSPSSNYNRITSLSTYNVGSAVSFYTYYLIAYDLTEMGLENTITTVDDAITYFGLTAKKSGYYYNLTGTLDFGVSREMYVPSCTYDKGVGVFNKYWNNYISDTYSINTKVFDCYCYLDNIDDVFKEFYYYDNTLWILSKMVDWNLENKLCKATFVKVNDIKNYTS